MNNENSSSELVLSNKSKNYLLEIAKWSKFFAIMGYIMAALMILSGLFMFFAADALESTPSYMESYENNPIDAFKSVRWVFIFVYPVLGAIYIIPSIYLYRSSSHLKMALKENSSQELTLSFQNLKSVFKFWGICTIIILGFYLLIFIIAALVGGLAALF